MYGVTVRSRVPFMCSSKLSSVLCVAVISSVFVVLAPFASATGNDPCKVLTAEKFSEIMGYATTTDKTASTQMSCFYQGPAHSGGQFMILTETASGAASRCHAQPKRLFAASRQWPDRRLLQAGEHHFFRVHQVNGSGQVAGTRSRSKTQSKMILSDCATELP
jgi:hypothetical protein